MKNSLQIKFVHEEFILGKSALQVSKKFNIPSRTLYDKVKRCELFFKFEITFFFFKLILILTIFR